MVRFTTSQLRRAVLNLSIALIGHFTIFVPLAITHAPILEVVIIHIGWFGCSQLRLLDFEPRDSADDSD